MRLELEHSFAHGLPGLCVETRPDRSPAPELVAYNQDLARTLGLDPAVEAHAANLFGGSEPIDGAHPVAMAYAGHQFGGFSPTLGDGRACLLGEWVVPSGQRVDLHLKGSGATAFSRGGDGKASLGPILREHLMGEAMHALGIPTTRSLAVIRTGERVPRPIGSRLAARRGAPLPDATHGYEALPGAILVRVAASHLRVGTFQFLAARGDQEGLAALVTYALARHAPAAGGPAGLLAATMHAQASLVAKWMAVGFVHGVMNTDNCAISGETIDYGPCAFVDAYDPLAVFSSIDHQGRYAYGRQPQIVAWNLARFAESLLPVLAEEPHEAVAIAEGILDGYGPAYNAAYLEALRAKLGLSDPREDDLDLVTDLLQRMHSDGADYTLTFRALADALRGNRLPLLEQFSDVPAIDAWLGRWQARIADPLSAAAAMDAVNPVVIPRNQHVEAALDAALLGDLAGFETLCRAVSKPYDLPAEAPHLAGPGTPGGLRHMTFCGT